MLLPVDEQLVYFRDVLLLRVTTDRRTGQPVEQQIAFGLRRRLAPQQQVYRQPKLGPRKSRGPAVVALQTAAGDERVIAVIDGVGGDELQLAHLVATEGTAGQVVALDPQAMAATPLAGGAFEVLQRGWRAGQVDPAWVVKFHPGPEVALADGLECALGQDRMDVNALEFHVHVIGDVQHHVIVVQ